MKKLRQGIGGRVGSFLRDWSLPRQLAGQDPLREAAQSTMSEALRPRLEEADTVGTSICPFCAVGCGQLVYAKNGKPDPHRGRPAQPGEPGHAVPQGRLHAGRAALAAAASTRCCTAPPAPRSGTRSRSTGRWSAWRTSPSRTRDETFVERCRTASGEPHAGRGLARRRHAGQRGKLPHQEAARRRARHRQHREPSQNLTLLLGAQFGHLLRTRRRHHVPVGPARTRTASSSWAPTWRRTTRSRSASWWKRKRRGATIIHVDPRFTRTSALADVHAPIRSGSDIAFLGGLIHHILESDLWFREFALAYTNIAHIIEDGYQDPEDAGRAVLRLRRREQVVQGGQLAVQGQDVVPVLHRRAPRADAGAGRAEPRRA